MDKPTHRYHIVEFEDGVQLIPSNWFSNEQKTKAYWPNITNVKTYDRAVRLMIDVDYDSWKEVSVVCVLGSTTSFEIGKQKLKEAERITDINSDADSATQKKKRRLPAAKILSSDEDECESPSQINKMPPLPSAPSKKYQMQTHESDFQESQSLIAYKRSEHTISRKKESGVQDVFTISNKIASPKTDITRSSVPGQHCGTSSSSGSDNIIPGTASENSNSNDDCRKNDKQSTSIKTCGNPKQIIPKSNAGAKVSSKHVASNTMINCTCESPAFEKYMVQNFTDIKFKLKAILLCQNEISDKLNVLSDHDSVESKENGDIDESLKDIILQFPLSDEHALARLEEALLSRTCYEQLVTELRKIGGNDIKSVVLTMMTRIFSNAVAEQYSWYGKKKKKVFCDLKISQLIIDVTRKHYPNTTDSEISERIRDWLRRATERERNAKTKDAVEATTLSDDQRDE